MYAKIKSLVVPLVLALLLISGALALLGGWQSGLSPVYAQGTARYVAPGGNDSSNDCSTASNPCRTVQYAVGQASAGDDILLASGVYTANGAEAIADISKNLTVRGGYTTTDNFA
ncbi:MAG: hypothetical protein ACP5J4_21350, partial [Anaerolineae bacterium]